MSEQNDRRLHDWVRREMGTYRPPYNPADWNRMQQKLPRKPRWRTPLWSTIALVLLGLPGWLWLTFQPVETVNNPLISQPITNKNPEETTAPTAIIHQPVLPSVLPENPRPVARKARPAYPRPPVTRPLIQAPDPLKASTKINTLPTSLNPQILRREPVAFSREEAAIIRQVITGDFGPDSTSYQTLSRNLDQWPDAVIVCDLTTSMYPYTTQLLAWFNQNARKPSVRGAIFFTDCDSLGQQTRPGGPPGRMFITHKLSSDTVLSLLVNAARNTVRNKDDAENDVEALLVAQRQFPDAKHLILIADNMNTVKDMARLEHVKKPVHVVLCGTTGGDALIPFQEDYFAIARQTGGSMHTLEDDLNPTELTRSTTLRVGPYYYRYNARKKRFKLTPFDHRPKRFLNFLWF